jgi:LacI family transcriptional regulator
MKIKEIAELANVSIGTVDRVLHNRGRVAKDKEELIRKIIKENGYTQNIFGSRLSISKNYVFLVIMPKLEQDSSYWEMSARGIEKAANELKLYKVSVRYLYYDRYSTLSQKRTFAKALDEDVDGILLAPINTDAVLGFINKLSGKTPYVLFDSELPDTQANCFIGQDSFQSGVVAAKLMSLLIKDGASSIAIVTIADDIHIKNRADGFRSFFSGNELVYIKTFTLDLFNDKNTNQFMEKVLHDTPNCKGIFIPNSATHIAAEYFRNQPERQVYIIGYDIVKDNIELLNEGHIDFLISQKADVQGFEGIIALYKSVVIKEQVKNNRIMMPIDIITKENLQYYLSNNG